ncbi:MAG TPA: ribonuclease P protein component [Candidatus Eisenbacteria bacterium]|nr:ribonuclease P protein component [Candidatus Eisenbacteria bacterium]
MQCQEPPTRSQLEQCAGSRVFGRLQSVTAVSAFPKSKRLLRHADFQRVYQAGRRQFTGNMTVFFLRRTRGETGAALSQLLRVGFTVGKALGGAVERNRLKRRMREAVRLSWPAVEELVDVVFHPRKSVLDLPFDQVAAEVARGLQLALQRAREAPATQPARRKNEQ